ncbi:MAG: CHAT domain-containing protein [Bryobacterales bacterium]|nr:CHAT domain-containing protein [Bryobacterales bacterium]
MAQNRPIESIRLAEQALLRPSEQLRKSHVHETIARALLKLGRKPEALAELRKAIANERALYASLPFADELQISRENFIQPRFELFALTAADLMAERPNPALATEAFEVVQENRAASLRKRASADEAWRDRLPDAYWQTLAELRRMAARQSAPDSQTEENMRRARARLVEFESAAGVPGDLRSGFRATVPQLQSRLQPGEIVAGFLLAEPHSLRWVIDRNSIRMAPIASRASITAAAAKFRRHVQQSDPAHRSSGAELAKLLFDGIPTASSWTIIPDDVLFTIPFAALALPGARDTYLIQSVAIRLVPTAGFLDQTRPAPLTNFLGFGDPVTNRADPRLSGKRIPAGAPDLPRLPNSAEEIRRCSRLWPDHRILSGPLPGIDSLRAALAAKPRVLHFATHVYRPPQQDSPVIALGYTPNGDWNVLTGRDIVALGVAPELVTLSGCGSGRGPLAPGSGLLGLTRAWLMGGTGAVMATLWEVPDGGGQLLEDYYQTMLGIRRSGTSRNAAYSLQKAQLNALRSSPPAVWAPYFVIGAI